MKQLARDEFWDALKEYAHRNHQERVSKNSDRIAYPRCVNFITEISNYTWAEDKFGAKINTPIDDFNHLMDAMRYALEDMLVGPAFSFD